MTIQKESNRSAGKFLKNIVAASAFGACTFAQADVMIDFEAALDSPFLFTGDHVEMGQAWIETYGGTRTSDLAGAIIDGSDSGNCFLESCPVNNRSHYYAGLDDGYFYFGLTDASNFKVKSLQASFIGAGQTSFPAVSGILVLQGFNQADAAVGAAVQVPLFAPNSRGEFSFSTYSLGGFSDNLLSYVRVLGYACDAGNSCTRTSNLANFAIDNIETVPEPTTWALLGLGLAGLAFARRRAA